MFTFIFLVCVINTVVLIGMIIATVLSDHRVSREIGREGAEFLARRRL